MSKRARKIGSVVKRENDVAPPIKIEPGMKVLHLVRHGQSVYNEAVHQRGYEADRDIELHDAGLTERGKKQVAHLHDNLAKYINPAPEVVLVSPLTRAIQTALGVFGPHLLAVPAASTSSTPMQTSDANEVKTTRKVTHDDTFTTVQTRQVTVPASAPATTAETDSSAISTATRIAEITTTAHIETEQVPLQLPSNADDALLQKELNAGTRNMTRSIPCS